MSLFFFSFLQTKSIPAEESHGPKESTERKGTFFQTWWSKYNYQIGHFYLKEKSWGWYWLWITRLTVFGSTGHKLWATVERSTVQNTEEDGKWANEESG